VGLVLAAVRPALAADPAPETTKSETAAVPPVSAAAPVAPETAPAEVAPTVPPTPAAEPAPATTPSDVELAEIERALAADAVPAGTTAPEPARSPPSGGIAVQSMLPDISIIGDFALAAFSEDENHQTGAHDPKKNGFNLQQLELAFGAAVDPYFRFDGNLVFSQFGVELEEAYGTTLDLPYRLQARFGQLLTRFGRLNATHPHSWDFVDQPFAYGRVFGAEGSRGLGMELSYLTPLPWYVELVASATEAAGEATARSFYGGQDLGVDVPKDLLYVGAIKQFFPLSDDWSLLIGVSGAFGPNGSGRSNRSEVYGMDVYLKYRSVSEGSTKYFAVQSEWLYRRRQVPEDVLADVSGYAQAIYKFAQRFSVGARYEYGSPARGSDGDVASDPLDPEWTDDRTRLAANVTHYPSEFSRVRLQGSRDMGLGEPVWAGFLALEVLIGSHGAHAF